MNLQTAALALAVYGVGATIWNARRYWRERRYRRDRLGFVASGMTIDTMGLFEKQTEDDRRREYRVQLIALLDEAEYALTEAKATGRRLDCLGKAVSEIRGALRNVCEEDGVEFVSDDERAEWRETESVSNG